MFHQIRTPLYSKAADDSSSSGSGSSLSLNEVHESILKRVPEDWRRKTVEYLGYMKSSFGQYQLDPSDTLQIVLRSFDEDKHFNIRLLS
jgi:hypothetical protein